MTVQEAIIVVCYVYRKFRDITDRENEALAIIKKCIEELEQYRALGTVEGFKSALDSSLEYYNQMKEYKAKLQEYEALGTPTQICERIGGLDVELGKYHCLGTVEEIEPYIRLAEKLNICDLVSENKRLSNKIQFLEIELKEAKEKQVAKKCEIYTALQPRIDFDNEVDVYECPNCGTHIGAADENNQFPYCWNCGQKLDWEEGRISD